MIFLGARQRGLEDFSSETRSSVSVTSAFFFLYLILCHSPLLSKQPDSSCLASGEIEEDWKSEEKADKCQEIRICWMLRRLFPTLCLL